MYEYLPQNMFLLCALLWYCRLPRCQCHSDVGPVMFVCSPYIARDVSKCVCVSVCLFALLFHKLRFWGMFCVPSLFWFAVDKEKLKQRQKEIQKQHTARHRRNGNGNKIYSYMEPIYFNFISHLDGASCARRVQSDWFDDQLSIVFSSCKCVFV